MDKNLELCLKGYKDLIENITETENGINIKVHQKALLSEKFGKLVSDLNAFQAEWQGSAQHSFFIPSLQCRLKRNLAEFTKITLEISDSTFNGDILQHRADVERILSERETSATVDSQAETPIKAQVEAEESTETHTAKEQPVQVEPQKDSVETVLLQLRNHFTSKLSAVEIESKIALLLREGFTRSQIASKVNAGESTIYKYSTAKKMDSTGKKEASNL